MAETIKSFPNNSEEYIGAEYVMKWLHGRTSGVFAGGNNAAVTALTTPGMGVQVSDGVGWLSNSGDDGIVWWVEDEAKNGAKRQLAIATADSALNRIDRVIVEWKTTNYADLPELKILQGTAASSPTAPALTNSSTVRQISLARISVAAGTTAITAAMITDERLNSSVCGLVTESVSVDTSTINAQFQGFLSGIEAELNRLTAGTDVELKKLIFTNTSVAASAWTETNTYESYPYRAAVALSGVLSTMVPEVAFSLTSMEGNGFAPVAESYNGGIYIYASSAPESAVTIPTIWLWREA
jgi:hypothetical protein